MYIVYVIQNSKGNIYIGYTKDIVARLKRHNGLLPSKLSSYTHKHLDNWTLVYKEVFNNQREARVRERQLKTAKGRQYIHTIINGRVAQR